MAQILLGVNEMSVDEGKEDVLSRIVASKDGLRSGSGAILAPPGWMVLTASGTGEQIYFQTVHIAWVRDD